MEGMGWAEGRTSRDIWSGGPVGGVMSEVEHNHPGTLYRQTRRHSKTDFRFGKWALTQPSYTLHCKTTRAVHFSPSGLGAPLSDTQTSRASDTNKDD